MKLSEAMASLTPEQREAVEARFEALKIELAHAEGAAIIATDRPNEEFNERLAEMNAALRARVAELEADAERLNWLQANPRLSTIRLAGESDRECYMYAVAGAPGLKLREIIDAARAAEAKK